EITTISDQTVLDGNPISPITVTVDNPNTTITVKDLPDGVTYNPSTKTITGTPAISDWGAMEEHREITVTVEAKDSAGNITTETFKITVQRDTDGDGDPDVTDPDDDNDGYSDIEESAKRTNPKDPNSKPSTTINPINDQTVVEGNPINEITVVTDNSTATITVKDLP
ncbi:MAG: YSIRK signal domain/LPXTG anchor domain surface protein, partial [Solobacterium sp.]|nr:YSIRK signal domain/LPXTG anchor domain surface protein [Solobacterium sp.]